VAGGAKHPLPSSARRFELGRSQTRTRHVLAPRAWRDTPTRIGKPWKSAGFRCCAGVTRDRLVQLGRGGSDIVLRSGRNYCLHHTAVRHGGPAAAPVMGPANRANLLARRRRKGHEKLSPPWSVAELGSAAVGHAALTPAASPIFRDMLRGAVPLPRFAGQDKETE
jgi:hypothetical protein